MTKMIIMSYQFIKSYRTDKSDSRRICQPKRNTYHNLIMPNNAHDILYRLSVPNTYLLIKPKQEEKTLVIITIVTYLTRYISMQFVHLNNLQG